MRLKIIAVLSSIMLFYSCEQNLPDKEAYDKRPQKPAAEKPKEALRAAEQAPPLSKIDLLTASTDTSQWIALSEALRLEEVNIETTSAPCFVKYTLSQMTSMSTAEQKTQMAAIIALGDNAVDPLIEAIEYASLPAPIFSNAALANLPIFSMQALQELKAWRAIPALIKYLPKHRSDVVFEINGRVLNSVSEALAAISGEDFGTDQQAWAAWWIAKNP